MKMISLKTKMVAMNGCAVLMEADVVTEVPERLVETAMDVGCIPANNYAPATDETPEEVEQEAESMRALAIVTAIKTLVEGAEPSHFSKDGTPKVRAVEKLLGYDITAAERDAAWDTFQGD